MGELLGGIIWLIFVHSCDHRHTVNIDLLGCTLMMRIMVVCPLLMTNCLMTPVVASSDTDCSQGISTSA